MTVLFYMIRAEKPPWDNDNGATPEWHEGERPEISEKARSRQEEEQGLEVGHVWSGHMECLRNSEEASAARVEKWGELKEVKLCKATFLFWDRWDVSEGFWAEI